MITRRNLLVGSAAVLGSLSVGAPALGRAQQRASVAAAASGFRVPGGLTCPVPYMSRAAWGADESYRWWGVEYAPVQALTVHHSGFYSDSAPVDVVRSIYYQQAVAKGWGDIGYHLLIDDAGVVYEGRYSGSAQYPVFGSADALMVTGAHVGGWNTGNIGVCLLGYLVNDGPTAAARESLITVLGYLAAVGRVNALGTVNYLNPVNCNAAARPGVGGHRNWAATECPGGAFYGSIGSVRSGVASLAQTLPQGPAHARAALESADPSASATDSPSPTSDPTTAPPTQNPPAACSAQQPAAPPPQEKRGDEYVPAARKASPNVYKTVKPSATATPTTAAPTTTFPLPTDDPTTTPWPVPPAAAASASGSDWIVPTATAAGVTVAGTLGGLGAWWWRRRRTSAATPPSIVDEQPTGSTATLEIRSSQPPEDGASPAPI